MVLPKVLVVGLGAMGSGIYSTLSSGPFDMLGYDVYKPCVDKIVNKDADKAERQAKIEGLIDVNDAFGWYVGVHWGI